LLKKIIKFFLILRFTSLNNLWIKYIHNIQLFFKAPHTRKIDIFPFHFSPSAKSFRERLQEWGGRQLARRKRRTGCLNCLLRRRRNIFYLFDLTALDLFFFIYVENYSWKCDYLVLFRYSSTFPSPRQTKMRLACILLALFCAVSAQISSSDYSDSYGLFRKSELFVHCLTETHCKPWLLLLIARERNEKNFSIDCYAKNISDVENCTKSYLKVD
jgi:hypothetical protein